MPTREKLKSIFESMLFVWGEPLDAKLAGQSVGLAKDEATEVFRELAKEYEERGAGIRIREIGAGFQFVTDEQNHDYIRTLCTPVRERKLSQAALETLAIVAYRQPVTKSEIDSVRGVKSDRVLDGLIAKGLVEERGRSSAVGRPMLFGTTQTFLEHLDLKSLKELPEISDIEEAIAREDEENGFDEAQTRIDVEALVS
jgi:segregation and condensation protein B